MGEGKKGSCGNGLELEVLVSTNFLKWVCVYTYVPSNVYKGVRVSVCPCIRPALFADRVQKQSMHLPPPSWSLIPFNPNRNQVFLEKMTDSRVGVECICDEPGTLCQKVSVQR